MFQKVIKVDDTSYIEVSTRIVDKEEVVCLTFRTAIGKKSTAISALLDPIDADAVVNAINDAIKSRRTLDAQDTK